MEKPDIEKIKTPEIMLFIVFASILSLILLFIYWQIGVVSLIILITLTIYGVRYAKKRQQRLHDNILALLLKVDTGTKNAVNNIPMPLIVTNVDGFIIWYNDRSKGLLDEKDLLGKDLSDYIEDLNIKHLTEKKAIGSFEIEFNEHIYDVKWYVVHDSGFKGSTAPAVLFYWDDISDIKRLSKRYQEEKVVVGYIFVDNYNEVLEDIEESLRPIMSAEIDRRIREWGLDLNIFITKYEKDKFVTILNAQILEKIKEKKFDILDAIRDINFGNKIQVTLSIGMGTNGDGAIKTGEYAQAAVELALGRGGDQAVLKDGPKISFYGGKTKTVEKRTRVKSRVIASAIRQLMEQCKNVYIMSHEIPDLDSMGAALGMYRCARHVKKDAFIVLDKPNAGIGYIVEELKEREGYTNSIISADYALSNIEKDTLLIIVDTHKPSFTEVPPLIEKADRIVVIDHHRRSTEQVENAILTFIEPYASSASEMITEIVQYFDDKVKLTTVEANAMLAGITMDTKNFIFKTGVRTYEAASYLRRSGSDPTAVRQLFQDDMDTFTSKAETVKNAVEIVPGIALSSCPSDIKNGPLTAAQAADSLITIKGIKASFVLCQGSNGAMISARSLGDINVQMILEKLGGGGHLSIAGAQLDGVSIEKAKMLVIRAVEEYIKEETKDESNID